MSLLGIEVETLVGSEGTFGRNLTIPLYFIAGGRVRDFSYVELA